MNKITVLLADDHTVVREGLRALLQATPDIGVVGEADNGRLAVQLAQNLQPDVVVMDVVMPQLNGHETAERVREVHPGLKTLFVSGYPEGARGRTDGPCAFLQKPFSVRTFTRKVREVLDAGA